MLHRPKIIVRCLICGETTRYIDYPNSGGKQEVCDKCKAAVLEMRKRMEADNGKQEPHNDHAEIL